MHTRSRSKGQGPSNLAIIIFLLFGRMLNYLAYAFTTVILSIIHTWPVYTINVKVILGGQRLNHVRMITLSKYIMDCQSIWHMSSPEPDKERGARLTLAPSRSRSYMKVPCWLAYNFIITWLIVKIFNIFFHYNQTKCHMQDPGPYHSS
jgi:hypothetical protein